MQGANKQAPYHAAWNAFPVVRTPGRVGFPRTTTTIVMLERFVVCRGHPGLGITTSYRDKWHLTASHLLFVPTHHMDPTMRPQAKTCGMMLTEGMPNQARLLAHGVEWQRSGGRLKPNGDRG